MAQTKITAAEIIDFITVTSNINRDDFYIITKDSVDSTNDYLLNLLASEVAPAHKTVVLAEQQTAGKGQAGRTWISPPVGNIYMSLYWQFNTTHEKLYALSLTVGVAVARVLKANALDAVKLKWPNDIFWNGHKLGGILIETKKNSTNKIDVVLGIGLNLQGMDQYQDKIQQKFVTLESALQHQVSRNKLIAQILIELDRVLILFQQQGFNAFLQEWNMFSASPADLMHSK